MDDAVVDGYLRRVLTVCKDIVDAPLVAGWAVGSLATGDFEAGHSDVDIVLISGQPLPRRTKQELARVLSHDRLPCPAHGLDLVIYSEQALRPVPRDPVYEFSIATGIDWDDEISFGGAYPGGLIDLAVARQRGQVLCGRGPAECLSDIPEGWIRLELLNAIRWHAEKVHDRFHDPTGANAVLNACRALAYLSRGEFVSKSDGAAWYTRSRDVSIVVAALEARRDLRPEKLARTDVLSLLDQVAAEFDAGTV